MSKKSGIGKLLLGLGTGIGLGVLFAPKKGSETREELKTKTTELVNKVKNTNFDDIKDNIEEKINEIKCELDDLDKERVLNVAKEKSKAIKKQIEELYEVAKDKTTPVITDTLDNLREYAIKITKEVLEKLEKENKESN